MVIGQTQIDSLLSFSEEHISIMSADVFKGHGYQILSNFRARGHFIGALHM